MLEKILRRILNVLSEYELVKYEVYDEVGWEICWIRKRKKYQ
jgi:hypothetical protein